MNRTEKDSLGVKEIPATALYGIQTLRGAENFQMSQQNVDRRFIYQIVKIKRAAAYANYQTGVLTTIKYQAIEHACNEILTGKYDDAFITDRLQGGAGTTTNMNVNEVITNVALQYLGKKTGEYQYLHPLDDVNRSQSTNDVYPSGGKLTTLIYLEEVITAVKDLKNLLNDKGRQWGHIKKMGRTQLQEAIPTTLGASFQAYASALTRCLTRLTGVKKELCLLNLGGTAIGNCLNASPAYQKALYEYLQQDYEDKLAPAEDLIDATQHIDSLAAVSSALKTLAITLGKLANDLRLLSSGPRSGFCELMLPAVQAGSSIMPGKVNPVIPEVVNQIVFQVMGNDLTISLACEAGQLELNAFEPIIFANLFESCQLLTAGCQTLGQKCIQGIMPNQEKCTQDVYQSTGTITQLTPLIGYETASRIVKEALAKKVSVFDLLQEENLLSGTKIEALRKKIS